MKKTIATVFNDRERLALDGQVSAALDLNFVDRAQLEAFTRLFVN